MTLLNVSDSRIVKLHVFIVLLAVLSLNIFSIDATKFTGPVSVSNEKTWR